MSFDSSIKRTMQLLPVYAVFIPTFALAGLSKFAEPGVPQWFADQFGATFLASLPGLPVAFYSIAILEVATTLFFVASLLTGELHKNKAPHILNLALFLAAMVFAQLGFGLRLVNEFTGAFNLFTYAVGTGVAYLYVTAITTGKGYQTVKS